MNRCSPLLNLREMHTKISLRCHYSPEDSWKSEVRRPADGEGLCRQMTSSLLWGIELGESMWGALPHARASLCSLPITFALDDYLFDPMFVLRDRDSTFYFVMKRWRPRELEAVTKWQAKNDLRSCYAQKVLLSLSPSSSLPPSLSFFLPASLLQMKTESQICA